MATLEELIDECTTLKDDTQTLRDETQTLKDEAQTIIDNTVQPLTEANIATENAENYLIDSSNLIDDARGLK